MKIILELILKKTSNKEGEEMTRERFNLKPTKLLEFNDVVVNNYTLKELMILDNIKVNRVEERALEDWDNDFKYYGNKIVIDFITDDDNVRIYSDDPNDHSKDIYIIMMDYCANGKHTQELHLTQNKIMDSWWNSKIVKIIKKEDKKTKKVKK
jgi:hypothetical protein